MDDFFDYESLGRPRYTGAISPFYRYDRIRLHTYDYQYKHEIPKIDILPGFTFKKLKYRDYAGGVNCPYRVLHPVSKMYFCANPQCVCRRKKHLGT